MTNKFPRLWDIKEFLIPILMEVLGKGFLESPPECDRAHCTLSEKPKQGQRAQPIIIRLHRYQVKERIIHEARARRGKLQYQGSPISICEDYAPEVVEQCQKYQEVMSELYNLGFKPALLFPTRLVIVMKDGGGKRLSSRLKASYHPFAWKRPDGHCHANWITVS